MTKDHVEELHTGAKAIYGQSPEYWRVDDWAVSSHGSGILFMVPKAQDASPLTLKVGAI